MNSLASTFALPFAWWRGRHLTSDSAAHLAYQAENRCFHLAFHRAYRAFAQRHPQWISHRFDADLLRPTLLALYEQHIAADAILSPQTAIQLAQRWADRFGCLFPVAERIRQRAALQQAAAEFLRLFQHELRR